MKFEDPSPLDRTAEFSRAFEAGALVAIFVTIAILIWAIATGNTVARF